MRAIFETSEDMSTVFETTYVLLRILDSTNVWIIKGDIFEIDFLHLFVPID